MLPCHAERAAPHRPIAFPPHSSPRKTGVLCLLSRLLFRPPVMTSTPPPSLPTLPPPPPHLLQCISQFCSAHASAPDKLIAACIVAVSQGYDACCVCRLCPSSSPYNPEASNTRCVCRDMYAVVRFAPGEEGKLPLFITTAISSQL